MRLLFELKFRFSVDAVWTDNFFFDIVFLQHFFYFVKKQKKTKTQKPFGEMTFVASQLICVP